MKQQRAARTRQALVRAAAQEFAQDGFVVASLASISKKAGVSNGALHFHFESKRALARAVEEEAVAVVREIVAPAGGGGSEPLQRLIDATRALMARLDQDAVVRAGFQLGNGVPRRKDTVDLRGLWQSWVEEVLEEAERQGALAVGVSAPDATMAVVAATVGFEQLGVEDRMWMSEATLQRFWDLLLPCLASAEALDGLLSSGAVAVSGRR